MRGLQTERSGSAWGDSAGIFNSVRARSLHPPFGYTAACIEMMGLMKSAERLSLLSTDSGSDPVPAKSNLNIRAEVHSRCAKSTEQFWIYPAANARRAGPFVFIVARDGDYPFSSLKQSCTFPFPLASLPLVAHTHTIDMKNRSLQMTRIGRV